MPFGLHLRRKKSERRWVRKSRDNPADAFPCKQTYLRELQEGSEGAVQAWAHKSSGIVIAVKVVKSKEELPREVQILTVLPDHPHILKCLAYYDKQPTPEKLSIVLEYCDAGDLFDFYWYTAYPRNKSVFSEAFMWSVFGQLASALAFLHEGVGITDPREADHWKTIVHRDIKMENILVKTIGAKDDWSAIVIKLADFGLSAYYNPAAAKLPRGMGTTTSWAPEVTWRESKITPAADIWSLGHVMHMLAHSFGPLVCPEQFREKWTRENVLSPYPDTWPEAIKQSYWGATTPRKVVAINQDSEAYVEDYRRRRPSPKYSDALNECLMMTLKMEPKERAGAGELLEHVEEAHAGYLFQQLMIETKNETAAARKLVDEES